MNVLFRSGNDTQEIARILNRTNEAEVYNEIARLKGDLQPEPEPSAPKQKSIPPSKTPEYISEYNREHNKRLRAGLAKIREEARI